MSLTKKIQQRENEEVLFVVKRFGLIFFWRYFFGILIIFACAFFLYWLLSQGVWGRIGLGLGLIIGVYLIIHAWFFQNKNALVITTERVVDVNRLGWFEEVICSAAYSDIKDIYLHRRGVWASVFNYAKIVVETKSQRSLLELEAVHKPEKILAAILEQIEQSESNSNLNNKENIYKKFIRIIPALSEAELCEINDLVVDQLDRLEEDEPILSNNIEHQL